MWRFSINYNNEQQEELNIPWFGSDGYNNAQSGVVNEVTGDLFIGVSQTEPVQLYFKEELRDKRTPRIWKMLEYRE